MDLKYLWDTNTVIYYLQGQYPLHTEKFMDRIVEHFRPSISVITEIELLCWRTSSQSDLKILREFIADAVVINLDDEIKLKTAEIRREHKIKLPDAIIAATALVHELDLLTRNVSDFKNIDRMTVIDPFIHG